MRARLLLSLLLLLGAGAALAAEDSASVQAAFKQPPREYSSAPLWVWNDLLTEDEVLGTLRALADEGYRQVFVHPRPGLMTPYLSPDWFGLWRATLREAEKRDMNIWIYDENSYPSGFAGGAVPVAMPESRGRGLHFSEEKKPGKAGAEVLAVFRKNGEAYENVTAQAKAGEALPEGAYLVAKVERSKPSPWFGGKTYVDLTYPGVTEKFLDTTLGAYRREIGDQFGKHMPGSFTDEPHLAPAGGLHWTDDLPELFQKRWGYSLIDVLPSLTEATGDWQRVRHNYYQVLLEAFIERWAKPYYEYCARNGLEFTGHYWEHSWPDCGSAPDSMAMGAWQQRPGIDILFNQYKEDVHAQFGNDRSVLELASVANQCGWKRTLCETYGGSGWDARFEDFKRIGDWVYVLGVNTLNEHLSHITLRGARKRDYPPTFSYHEPWWEAYHTLEAYFTRLSLALSSGQQINSILLLEPTTTAWMYQDGGDAPLKALGGAFQKLVTDLAKAQVEFDLGCEEIIAEKGSVEASRFVVGKRAYDTVILPPLTESLNTKTVEFLESFVRQGGLMINCAGASVQRIDGQANPRAAALTALAGCKQAAADELPGILNKKSGFSVQRAPDDKGMLYHHRRQLADGDLLFLVNTSIDAPTSGQILSPMHGAQEWNLETAATAAYAFQSTSDGLRAEFTLPPCGSLLLFLSKAETAPAPVAAAAAGMPLVPSKPITVKRARENVLTLDYMDVTVGGETVRNLHFSRAQELIFKKNGLPHNPWDHAVQYGDELIRKTFPKKSGFEAAYRFTIEGAVPSDLQFVLERPDLYTVRFNGKKVHAKKDAWWVDRAFGRIDLAKYARAGENVVTIKAQPFTMFHELESAYVIGTFSLKTAAKGFIIAPAQDMQLGAWNTQGCPLYGHEAVYTAAYTVTAPAGRYDLTLPAWYGSVAKVSVNGQVAGYLYHQPFVCDVTPLIKPGENIVEVTVFGTFKNTMGPHHGKQPLGFAGPGSFRDAPQDGPPPGESYSTIAYGLFEPFVLESK